MLTSKSRHAQETGLLQCLRCRWVPQGNWAQQRKGIGRSSCATRSAASRQQTLRKNGFGPLGYWC